ncbi:MAG: PEP/pyruvate-binding domain-containing protein [Patescibacteria group bacterium]
MPNHILWLNTIDKDDRQLVGEKAVFLGEIARAKFPTEKGFVITTKVFDLFLSENKLTHQIDALYDTISFHHPESIAQVSNHIKHTILKAPLSQAATHVIYEAYSTFGHVFHDTEVTVSLSPLDENMVLEDLSFTIKGEAALLEKLKELWASLFSPRVLLSLQHHKKLPHTLKTAILVQKPLHPEKTGTIFTIDPVTNNKNVMIIEVEHDRYTVAKTDFTVTKKNPAPQAELSDNQIMDIALLGKKLERQTYFPQAIEWGLVDTTIYLLRSRKITTVPAQQLREKAFATRQALLASGISMAPGVKHGPLIPFGTSSINKITGAVIFLTDIPRQIQQLKQAAALIISSEHTPMEKILQIKTLGIPIVAGTGKIDIPEGTVVTVNGTTGRIYKGGVASEQEAKSATKLFVNLEKIATLPAFTKGTIDGIGLLCQECLLKENIEKVCTSIAPHPVILASKYHDTDRFTQAITALKYLHQKKSLSNIHFLIASIRSVGELTEAKKLLTRTKLHRSPHFKVLLMIETPAQVIMLEKYIQEGIDGIVISTTALTLLLMGTQRGIDEAHPEYDVRNPAVLWAIKEAVQTAAKHHITSSIILSKPYPSVLEQVVEHGITSIIVNPEEITSARAHLLKAEKILVEKKFAMKHT